MTIDFSSTPDDGPTTTESEGSMFAPTPSWERGKKRSGLARAFGKRSSRVADEPRSFAAESEPELERPLETEVLAGDQRAYAFDPIGPADESAFETTAEPAFASAPTYANVSARRKTNAVPVAVAAGIVLLGGLAATGWYMSQPHTTGVAQLTPGEVTTTTTATAPVQTAENATPQEALPAASTSATAAPAPAAPKTTTTTTTGAAAPASVKHQSSSVARAKPVSRSAQDVTSDASTTAPVMPAQAAPQAAPTPPAPTPAAPLVLTLPPTQAAPVQTAPETLAPPPTQTAPQTAPQTTTPPEPPPQR